MTAVCPLLSSRQGADFDTFSKAAQKAEDVTYLQTKSADVAKAAGLSAAGVTVITNFEGKAAQLPALRLQAHVPRLCSAVPALACTRLQARSAARAR